MKNKDMVFQLLEKIETVHDAVNAAIRFARNNRYNQEVFDDKLVGTLVIIELTCGGLFLCLG